MARMIGMIGPLLALALLAEPAAAATKIEFFFPVPVEGKLAREMTNIAKRFNAEQSEIEVVAVYTGNYDETKIKAQAAMQAGKPPAVAPGPHVRVPAAARSPVAEREGGSAVDDGDIADHSNFHGVHGQALHRWRGLGPFKEFGPIDEHAVRLRAEKVAGQNLIERVRVGSLDRLDVNGVELAQRFNVGVSHSSLPSPSSSAERSRPSEIGIALVSLSVSRTMVVRVESTDRIVAILCRRMFPRSCGLDARILTR